MDPVNPSYPCPQNNFSGPRMYLPTRGPRVFPSSHNVHQEFPRPPPPFNFGGVQYRDLDGGGGEENNFGGHNYQNQYPFPPRQQNEFRGNRWRHPSGFRGGRGGRGRGGNRGGQQKHSNPKNQGGPPNQTERHHKPWMTDELLKLIREKDELQQKATESRNPDDWSIFKAVRKRTSLMMNDAKRLWEMNKPLETSDVGNQNEKSLFNCDTCDRSFPTEEIWNEHNSQHVTCKLDGCQFTAHPKVILKHIETQHSSNLFTRLKGFETPEGIAKWIELRKSKYPTEQNIQKKKEELAEKFKRGERFPSQGGRDNSKGKNNNSWNNRQESNFQHDRRPERRKSERFEARKNSKENSTLPASESTPIPADSSNIANPTFIPVASSVCQDQDKKESKSRYPARSRNQFSFGDENMPKVTPELERCSKNIIVLENFYSQIKMNESGTLVGKKIMLWNGEAQKLCQKIARTGLPMKKAKEEPGIESDESDHEDNLADVITDEEDVDSSMFDLPPSSLEAKAGTHSVVNAPEQAAVKVTADSTPITPHSSLCLVNYSSDSESDGEAPDEIPAVVVKEQEDGEINDESENHPVELKPQNNCNGNTKTPDPSSKDCKSRAIAKKLENQNGVKNHVGRGKVIKQRRPQRMPKLLRKLLENDIRRERNQILQVCRYIKENNFFDSFDPEKCAKDEAVAVPEIQEMEEDKMEELSGKEDKSPAIPR